MGGGGGGASEPKNGGVTALGVVATVLGSIALLGSFIPCLGALAIYIAVPAAICGIIGIVLANQKKVSMSLSIVGTVLATVGGAISIFQIMSITAGVEGINKAAEEFETEMEKARNNPQPPASGE